MKKIMPLLFLLAFLTGCAGMSVGVGTDGHHRGGYLNEAQPNY